MDFGYNRELVISVSVEYDWYLINIAAASQIADGVMGLNRSSKMVDSLSESLKLKN